VVTGRAGQWLSKSRIRVVSRASGCFLVGGGVWLALRGR
jgi:threonine/homoserine/homoserine lactone efflux protein